MRRHSFWHEDERIQCRERLTGRYVVGSQNRSTRPALPDRVDHNIKMFMMSWVSADLTLSAQPIPPWQSDCVTRVPERRSRNCPCGRNRGDGVDFVARLHPAGGSRRRNSPVRRLPKQPICGRARRAASAACRESSRGRRMVAGPAPPAKMTPPSTAPRRKAAVGRRVPSCRETSRRVAATIKGDRRQIRSHPGAMLQSLAARVLDARLLGDVAMDETELVSTFDA